MPSPLRHPLPDVAVVGAGIVGLACAVELAGRGLTVEVIERGRPGGGASAAAGGMLAPLAEAAGPDAFSAACRAARDLWTEWAPALEEAAGVGVDHDASGALAVARDDDEEAWLERLVAAAAALGEGAEEVPAAEARRRVPDLAPTVRRALHLPGDHRVDNQRVTTALVHLAEARGVTLRSGVEVVGLAAADGGGPVRVDCRVGGAALHLEAAAVLVAAGAASGALGGLPPLPIRPVRGQLLHLSGAARWPWTGTVRAGHRYAVPRGDGELAFGATQEEGEDRAAATLGGVGELTTAALALFPTLSGARCTATCGLRPATPDGWPAIGPRGGDPRLWVATGHFRNGILLAPWTARRVAAGMCGEPVPDLVPFAPERWV